MCTYRYSNTVCRAGDTTNSGAFLLPDGQERGPADSHPRKHRRLVTRLPIEVRLVERYLDRGQDAVGQS